jgi:hypothetical protein
MTSFGESLINNLAGVLSDTLSGQSGWVLLRSAYHSDRLACRQ